MRFKRYRVVCRLTLTDSRLSLSIEPSQVRLLPVREDPYRWSIVPGKEYLFEKNLSDQSTKIYKDLYQGINKDFKATKPPPSLLDKLPQRDNAVRPIRSAHLSYIDMNRAHLIKQLSESHHRSMNCRCRRIMPFRE